MNFNQPIDMTAIKFSNYVHDFIQVQSVKMWKMIRLCPGEFIHAIEKRKCVHVLHYDFLS